MKNKILLLAVAVSSLTMASCAKRPGAIVPVDIPMAAYSNLSCPQLSQELIKEQGKLSSLSSAQNNAATGDAVGVFLIGVPASSLTGGDKEGDISVSKGKVISIESTLKAKGCR
ncbi:hypothetical protein [Rhizobium tumorigenes]|uniref:hypothetical protein n=1 Tax=Rhizobium tumorigenes TaxID=2041385 RepID=UPI00241FE9EA|nr:hypothetical protein [Rhizobium tumorigenes]WFS02219.1 hypothetical protein PR016_06290 [Rhizobium tumorigenes]